MRLMIMFDLPTLTALDRKSYRQSAQLLEKKISLYSPRKGLIQSMIVTEKQFASMRFLTGKQNKSIENTFERLTII